MSAAEVEQLRARLAEAEETLRALRAGEIDALVASGPTGEQVLTIGGAEYPYRLIFEEMQEGAVTVGEDAGVLFSNRRFAEMVKTPREALIGASIDIWVTPASHPVFQNFLRECRRGSARAEIALRAADGKPVPVCLAGNSIRCGNVAAMCLVATDLTEQKRREEEVVLLNVLAMAISQAEDLDSAFRLLLRQICDTTGWDLGEVWLPRPDGAGLECGRAWYTSAARLDEFRRVTEPMEFAAGVDLPGRVWASGRPLWLRDVSRAGEFLRAGAAGQAGIRAGVGIPVLAENEVVAVVAFFMFRARDQDEHFIRLVSTAAAQLGLLIRRKRADEEIKRQAAMLREQRAALERQACDLARSNAELEQFAYVASHDLQEPLRMVSNYCQLLEKRYRGQLDEKADRFLGYAVEGALRMQKLISGLLEYSRVKSRGKDFESCNANILFERACADLGGAIRESAARVSADPLPVVTGDEAQLVRLLENLIGNAIKFRGEQQPEVHVSAARREAEWVFSIRDNGIGIDPQYFERIFVIFQRLHTRAEYPGTGMGLAISKKIVERRGGRIWVESEPGRGSTFCFSIPDRAPGEAAE